MALTLRVSGERVVGVAPLNAAGALDARALGYCRRGVADLCVGRAPDDALAIIERSCSLAGASHRQALCLALEAITQVEAPRDDRLVRSLFAEIERILARLWTLGLTARAAEQATPFRDALEQRELLFDALEAATGARSYWGVALPGGVRADVDLAPIREALGAFADAVEGWRLVTGPQGSLGWRTVGAGLLSPSRVAALGLTGVAACGADLAPDATEATADRRRSAPYDGYGDVAIAWPSSSKGTDDANDDMDGEATADDAADEDAADETDDGDETRAAAGAQSVAVRARAATASDQRGDVADRMRGAVADLALSVSIAQACINALGAEPTLGAALVTASQLRAGEGAATVAGPHGPVTIAIRLDAQGTITSLRLATPGAALLAALPETLTGRPVAQAAPTLASLDLCLECLDL